MVESFMIPILEKEERRWKLRADPIGRHERSTSHEGGCLGYQMDQRERPPVPSSGSSVVKYVTCFKAAQRHDQPRL
jgi:hypothetical protein